MTIIRNQSWVRRLLSGQPHQIIGGADNPYMLRWYVIPRNRFLNIYVHRFLRSDDDRALHDHPWWFVSLVLQGKYDEVTKTGVQRRRAGSLAYRPANWRHRVRLLAAAEGTAEISCWTVIITGHRGRSWGFWCPWRPNEERFVPWQDFGDAGCGEDV